ncbi:aminoglycoside phosphotransferase [Cellulomonas sp. DKR-3]|uniref:Maltokinase n=1 Tax=Cellulomonas fulva TaxID=2835530 RepID=A0ABS5U1S8_9CELL|nr:aminoglycoside phosphotransferase [Cellulomonas fulva]MBT0995340.1 aminoglycoside phosphotransferase [Cellulomonas fulva]
MLTARTPTADDDRVLAALAADLPARRWFPVKGAPAELTLHAVLPLTDPADRDAADVRVLLVRARAGSIDALLQVPVVVLPDGSAGEAAQAQLGDGRVVVDGAAHPAFLRAWFAVADGPGGAPAAVDLTTATAITGEQSNSSVVLGAPGRPGRGILKVLRALQAGENPDIDVPRHLVAEGYRGVPAPLAWLEARWPDPAGAQDVHGYLGVVSAFVEGAHDGFELACELAVREEPFDALAHRLGVVTAQMHTALTHAFPTVADADGPQRLANAVLDRFAWALAAVPALERYRAGVERTADEVRGLTATPPRQRVHGDLHLGQVLHVDDDWLVLDFEGEPLAPLEARTRPDLAVRDVAGLLRSFDYAAAVGGLTGEAADRWTTSARAALLAGYAEAAAASSGPGTDPDTDTRPNPDPRSDDPTADPGQAALLTRALELDKTLYEAVYESRNRPAWLPIPLAGLDRLVG